MSATTIRDSVLSGEASAVDVTREVLSRIGAGDGPLHAFLQVFEDEALAHAATVDAQIASGADKTALPLAGVPVALKDNICLSWGRTTCASHILESYESPFTATAAQRLIDAGAVIVGKTNLDEFAMGSSTEHSAFGHTGNPWDVDRSPGGSSGGSAAAVAARMVPLALGSDTGGSIRQPASLCGIVGLKPTYGRISRWGLVAFGSSLDQIGPLTCSVRDSALALSVMWGADPQDSTCARHETNDLLTDLDTPIKGLRVGLLRDSMNEKNHPTVRAAVQAAAEVYANLGAEIVEIDLPHAEYGIAAYYIVAPAEASSNLARYDGVRYGRRAEAQAGDDLEALYSRSRAEGFGAEVQRRIMLGTHALSSGYYDAYYNTALKVRRVIKGDYDAVFDADSGPGAHVVLMPTAPDPAFRIGEKVGDPLALYLEDLYTVGANLSGLPGVSLPGGFAEEDGVTLPVGVQLVGRAFDEATMLRAARMFEAATNHGRRAPEGVVSSAES